MPNRPIYNILPPPKTNAVLVWIESIYICLSKLIKNMINFLCILPMVFEEMPKHGTLWARISNLLCTAIAPTHLNPWLTIAYRVVSGFHSDIQLYRTRMQHHIHNHDHRCRNSPSICPHKILHVLHLLSCHPLSLLKKANNLLSYTLPLFQVISSFRLSRNIAFVMYTNQPW